MIEFQITQDMLERANTKAIAVGNIGGKSFMGGTRNINGFLGEEMFKKQFPQAVLFDTYDYDFMLKGKKIEVKTRTLKVFPNAPIEFALAHMNPNRDFDYIAFYIIKADLSKGWGLGWISKQDFFNKCKTKNKGEPMPQGGAYLSEGKSILQTDLEEFHEA